MSTKGSTKKANVEVKNAQPKYVIFHVEGGLGKTIASTSIFPAIKDKYPDRELIVVSQFPELILNDPLVSKAYRMGNTQYFYDTYIKKGDSIIMRREPYYEESHIKGKTPLHETWHKMYSLPYKKEGLLPRLAMNYMQKDVIPRYLLKPTKQILLIHTNGGPIRDTEPIYSWTRDIPAELAVAIVEEYKEQFEIIQICKSEKQAIPGVNKVIHNRISIFELIGYLRISSKRILIDSSLQHAAAALELPSTVLWIGTKPEMFGYSIHSNIKANSPKNNTKLIDALYFDYDLNGHVHQCPYNNVTEMFDLQKLKTSIDNT
jgi:signal peptidase I